MFCKHLLVYINLKVPFHENMPPLPSHRSSVPEDVFALLVTSLLTSCQRLVDKTHNCCNKGAASRLATILLSSIDLLQVIPTTCYLPAMQQFRVKTYLKRSCFVIGFEACFKRRASHVANALETIDNKAIQLITYCF